MRSVTVKKTNSLLLETEKKNALMRAGSVLLIARVKTKRASLLLIILLSCHQSNRIMDAIRSIFKLRSVKDKRTPK